MKYLAPIGGEGSLSKYSQDEIERAKKLWAIYIKNICAESYSMDWENSSETHKVAWLEVLKEISV